MTTSHNYATSPHFPLQEFYGLTASRISAYSPGDTSKGNERQINRRPNVRFNPKATLEIIARGPPKVGRLDWGLS